jgi:hypothetical protein
VVKWKFVDNPQNQVLSKPIGVLAALTAGFERVAAKPVLILPPLILDLLVWFGPHLTLPFLLAWIPDMAALLEGTIGSDQVTPESVQVIDEMLRLLVERYNLMSALSTLPGGMPFNLLVAIVSLPVGVPSLMAGRMPVQTPLGSPLMWEIGSLPIVLLIWAAFTGIGLGFGSFYHCWLGKHSSPRTDVASGWMTWGQMVLLFLLTYFGGILAATVLIIIVSLVGLIIPFISPLLFLLGLGLFFWVAVYLTFTAQGVVLYRFRLIKAMIESVHVVRWNLMSTVGFLFLSFLITWLSTRIWLLPGEDSWYSILALLGHAFVSTTLLVASYVFFQGRRTWLLQVREAFAIQSGRLNETSDSDAKPDESS